MKNITNNYIFSEDSDYVYVDDSNLGLIKIYLPSNALYSLDEDNIINHGSSNFNGYVNLDNGETLSITFQPFSEGRYRLGASTQYEYLEITDVLEVKRAIDFDSFSMVMLFFILLYMLLGGVMRVFSK